MSGVDLAPVTQYRKYVGGSTYQKDNQSGFANEYLKVIGEEYGGVVYTGALKEENGTPIVGRCTSESKVCRMGGRSRSAENSCKEQRSRSQSERHRYGRVRRVCRQGCG